MIPEKELQHAIDLVERLRTLVHDRELPADNRTRASASCHAIAQEHHHSIVLLIEHRLYASSFALVRSAFEAYVRAEWLFRKASDENVRRFLRNGDPPGIGTLIGDLETTLAFEEGHLSDIKKAHWNALCAYTHTGGLHVQRWNTPTAVESAYTPDEVRGALQFAALVGCMSAVGIANLAGSNEMALSVLEEVRSFEGSPTPTAPSNTGAAPSNPPRSSP
jgi:hypothetical protein